jgi:hypothetical protein
MARGPNLTDKHVAKDVRNPRIREGNDRTMIVIYQFGHSYTSFGIQGGRAPAEEVPQRRRERDARLPVILEGPYLGVSAARSLPGERPG